MSDLNIMEPEKEPTTIEHVGAFVNGVWEFRTMWTMNYQDHALQESYDSGRDWAHYLTLRYFEG
jgi:hypothetical protein